jgi:hypothetical protein
MGFAQPMTAGEAGGSPTLLTFVLLPAGSLDEEERDGEGENH